MRCLAPSSAALQVTVYDTDEALLTDSLITCSCLTELSVTDISSIYGDPRSASKGTYTEIVVDPTLQNAFTGYRDVFTVGSSLNHFFGRLSGGSGLSIEGTVTIGVR